MGSYVMITGAAGGLGKAFAAECASRGWNLFITDLSHEALEAVGTGMERLYGVDVICYPADLTDEGDREGLWDYVARRGLRFHMLLNVAGIDFEGLFSERSVDELHTMLRLNIEATVEMTRRVLCHRNHAQTLRIVNVSSLAAFYPMPVKAVYASSKRFLLDWSLALNQELRSSDVTVTALCPAGMPSNAGLTALIDAQGFAGRMTTMNVGDVAVRTIRRALRGRAVYVPSLSNQILRHVSALAPPRMKARAIDRRWRKTNARARASMAALETASSVGWV